jgi:hypothetical protein
MRSRCYFPLHPGASVFVGASDVCPTGYAPLGSRRIIAIHHEAMHVVLSQYDQRECIYYALQRGQEQVVVFYSMFGDASAQFYILVQVRMSADCDIVVD